MRAKEYLIQKIVEFGKKHTWLKYPTLALVSLISLFFLVVEGCLAKPKRAVIALVCMVLIVSQTWYFIGLASGEAQGNEPATGNTLGESQSMNTDPNNLDGPIDAPTTAELNRETQYTVRYNVTGVGQTQEDSVITASDLASFSIPAGVSASEYFSFVGWSLQRNNEQQIVTNLVPEYFNGANQLELFAIWKRSAYKLTFSPGSGEGQEVVRKVEIQDGIAKTLLTNQPFTKNGYTYTQWRIDDSATNLMEVNSEFSFGNTDVIVYPNWEPIKYTVEFLPGDPQATGSMESVQIPFDTQTALPLNTFQKTGYSFAGWRGEDGTLYPDGSTVYNLLDAEDTFTMTAQWTYKTASFSKAQLNGEYGGTLAETIDVYHNTPGDGNFVVSLLAASGNTMDGSVNATNLTATTGLTVSVANNTIQINSDGIKTVGRIDLAFNVHDMDHADEADITLHVIVELTKKNLEITGVEYNSKQYDGTTQLPIGSIFYQGAVSGDQVRVNNATQKGQFSDSNVGENKDITLSDIYLTGEDMDYYTVPTTVTIGGGVITKRIVQVTTKPIYATGETSIQTGQQAFFTVEIRGTDLPEATATADTQVITQAIANHYTCTYGAPDYLPGRYTIGIDKDAVVLTNYTLEVVQGELNVVQKNPVLDSDYVVSGNRLPDNQWYYRAAPTVNATGIAYDMVYLMNDPNQKAVTYTAALFSRTKQITEEISSNNQTLYLQLANSSTGAVTAVKELEIYVDITAPMIDESNISITTKNSTGVGKIGNILSFGNFFKEEVVIRIPVTDALSGPKDLTYYLDGSITGAGTTVAVRDGVAEFSIPVSYKGTIALVATDQAGNNTTRASLVGVEGSNLWVIENTAPDLEVTILDGESNPVYTTGTYYYQKVSIDAIVEDLDAGVASITWNITKNGESIATDEEEFVSDRNRIITKYGFKRDFTESGVYEVNLAVYDNAGNETVYPETIAFVVDGTAPTITVTPENYDEDWSVKKDITFTVTDTESGVDMISLKYGNENYSYTPVEGEENTFVFTVTKKGTYTIRAVDAAGNLATKQLVFGKVSDEVPPTPELITNPVLEDGQLWYTTNPTMRLDAPSETSDGTAIVTYYHIWREGEVEPYLNIRGNENFTLPGEGIWNIRYWTETDAGKRCQEDGLAVIRYDETAPEIYDLTVSGKDNANRITFKVSDTISKLGKLEVVYQSGTKQSLKFTELESGVYTAGFTAAMQGAYTIIATDVAGNVSQTTSVEPMEIKITTISGNTQKGFVVQGIVFPGSFDIDSVQGYYGLASGNTMINADQWIVNTDANGNKVFTAKYTQLTDNTRYQFKIVAESKNNERAEYTGGFKTGMTSELGINVSGTVVDETLASEDESSIAVMLYDGKEILQSKGVANGESFLFANVPDGVYTICAQNGNRIATEGLVIQQNKVIDPTSSIDLVLRSGQSTSVEYFGTDASALLVSGLNELFEDTTIFGSDEDYALINEGGTVEFCMKVTALAETDVPEADLVSVKRSLKKNEQVAKYMDLQIYKKCINAYGIVSETPITSISGGKSVRMVMAVPAQVQTKQSLSVIRVHQNTAERLADLDAGVATYTFESALYSTYALVYGDAEPVTTTSTASNTNTNTNTSTNTSTSTSTNTSTSTSTNTSTSTQQPTTAATTEAPTTRNIAVTTATGKIGGSPMTGDDHPIKWIWVIALMGGIGLAINGIATYKQEKKH